IGRVENRLRRLGRPPRTAEEMAEYLRRLGDLAAADLNGPMAPLLAELQSAGRAVTIELPGTASPLRWILAAEVALYRTAFPRPRDPAGLAVPAGTDLASPPPAAGTAGPTDEDPRDTIIGRFLQTHALIGLTDLIARYPIAPAEGIELLERWSEEGKAVR